VGRDTGLFTDLRTRLGLTRASPAEFWRDGLGGEWRCTGAGTPGTWIQIRPAAVTADPSSGTIPTGYLILNVATGHIKRHAGGYVWEVRGA